MAHEIDDPPKVNIQLEQAIQAILSDRPIAYHAALARALGSVTAGVLLSQLLYWQPRSRDSEGWFWKTQADIYEETGLGRREQETARRILTQAGVIEETRRGVPAKMHFRVNMSKLIGLISAHQGARHSESEGKKIQPEPAAAKPGESQYGGFRHTRLAETAIPVSDIPPYKLAGNRQSITETTPETTSESNPETTSSNGFELVANLQKPSDFQNSKKRDKSFDITGSGRSSAGDFTPVAQVLANSRASTADKKAPRRPRKGARTAEDARDESYYQSSQNRPSTGTRGRPPKATEQIEAVLEEISDEFHDGDHLPSNIGQAARLWKASGLSEGAFVSRLYEARAITKDYGMSIHKRASGEAGEWGMRNRMPYFFAVVRDLLGMKEERVGRAAST